VAPIRVAIMGAALDLGAGRRGVDMGPSAIRYAGLHGKLAGAGIDVEDRGNVETALAETRARGAERARFLDEILDTCARISTEVEHVREQGFVPLVLGGDHSIAIGTLSGLAAAGPGGVLWLDAHGDLNTPETTPSGNVHGMPLAAALGLCGEKFARDGLRLRSVDPEHVALVGVRSLDPGEQALVRELGIAVYTISDLDRRGSSPWSKRLSRGCQAPRSSMSPSISTSSIRSSPPASATPSSGACRTGRRTSRSSSSPRLGYWTASSSLR